MSSPKACSVPITNRHRAICRVFLFVYGGMVRFKIIFEFLAKQIDEPLCPLKSVYLAKQRSSFIFGPIRAKQYLYNIRY